MKYQRLITILVILLFYSCEFQTFSGPELNEEKMEYVNYYFSLLGAEEIEIHPLDHNWEDDDLPILIKNSKLIRIMDDNQLTNVATVDTLASILWDAVENKKKYKQIKIGFAQSSKSGMVEEVNYRWLDYPTDVLK